MLPTVIILSNPFIFMSNLQCLYLRKVMLLHDPIQLHEISSAPAILPGRA